MMKKYNHIFLGFVLFTIGLTVISNICVDVYKVFGFFNLNTKYVHENKRFRKIEHLLNNSQYNAYIMGNSRVNWIDVHEADQLSGFKFYNMAVGAEKIHTLQQRVEWLRDQGRTMEHLIVGLDYDVMFACKDIPSSALSAKEHPQLTEENRWSFFFPYLVRFDFTHWRRAYKNRKEPLQYFSDMNTGQWYLPHEDEKIRADPQAFVQHNFILDEACEPAPEEVAFNLKRLALLAEYLEKEDIKTTYVINPYHHTFYTRFTKDNYEEWLTKVVSICKEVWDFSGINSVTTNDYLYYEASHYRKQVGDMILKRIFTKHMDVPADFGRLLRGTDF